MVGEIWRVKVKQWIRRLVVKKVPEQGCCSGTGIFHYVNVVLWMNVEFTRFNYLVFSGHVAPNLCFKDPVGMTVYTIRV